MNSNKNMWPTRSTQGEALTTVKRIPCRNKNQLKGLKTSVNSNKICVLQCQHKELHRMQAFKTVTRKFISRAQSNHFDTRQITTQIKAQYSLCSEGSCLTAFSKCTTNKLSRLQRANSVHVFPQTDYSSTGEHLCLSN